MILYINNGVKCVLPIKNGEKAMGRLFATLSGKGGVGKSSFCVMLARALKRHGKVLLIDMDTGLSCLDLMLKVDDRVVFNLNDILNGEREVSEVAIHCEDNLDLIAAPEEKPESKALRNFLFNITEEYDFVIADFPAGKNTELLNGMPLFCEFLVVSKPDPVSLRDAEILSGDISGEYLSKRLIINSFILKDMQKAKGIARFTIDDIIDKTKTRLLGIIPYEKEVAVLQSGRTLKNKSRAQKSVERITLRILGRRMPLPNLKKI